VNLKYYFKKAIRKSIAVSQTALENSKYHEIANTYNINGFKRIYLVHIRKTGGTSLNNMFLSLSQEDSNLLYGQLDKKPNHRLLSNGLIFVGWNVRLINRGDYFYAFSHTPWYELDLPPCTFTISCFRDPIGRVLSHYNMLMGYRKNGNNHPTMRVEGRWLGKNLSDYLQNIPKNHLLNQLYMFSRNYNVEEAVSNVKNLSHIFFSETFNSGINSLNIKSGLNLEPIHIRKASYKEKHPEAILAELRQMLNDEYRFLNIVRGLVGGN